MNSPKSSSDRVGSNGGGKAARLWELQAAGFRVPEFVVSPNDVRSAVEQLGTPLAVRSSASVEDNEWASFAGQFESFLNLASLDEVEEAIGRCRASVGRQSVLQYCEKNGIDAESIRMDVVVQRMVVPEMCSLCRSFFDCGHDFRVGMPQQQCAVSAQEINILVAVDIPFASAGSAFDVQRYRFKMSKVVADSAT